MRVKRGVAARAKHKKILEAAKGMQHYRTRSFRLAKQGVIKSLRYSYRDRRNRKRDLRALWITRINNAAREQEHRTRPQSSRRTRSQRSKSLHCYLRKRKIILEITTKNLPTRGDFLIHFN